MSEEEKDIIKEMIKERQEEINRVEDYVNTGLEEEELQALQNALNYIDKLEKENAELKEDNNVLCEMAFIKPMPLLYTTPAFTSTEEFISIDEIKQLVGYEENEDVSKDDIISLIKLMWEEFNRLEDIEDYMETQCISKKRIKAKIKELEEKDKASSSNVYGYGIKFLKELLEE
jgi:hypothetical protein